MESRRYIRNLVKSIHSLLGLKTHLTSTWVESVCDIITHLPPSNEQSCGFSEKKDDYDDDASSVVMKIQGDLAGLHAHLNQLNLQRKQALNDFLDLKGNIRVFCRIKPMNALTEKHQGVVVASDSKNVILKLNENKSKLYSFDKVFHPHSSQDEVFSEIEPVIKSALDGYNTCIFAYGQTGTGKTFTMEGEPDCPGVVPRTMDALFKQAEDSCHKFIYTFSMVEIYMGNLRDLLVPRMTQSTDLMRQSLTIQADPKGGVEIGNLVAIRVSDINQAKRLYKLGSGVRSTASTNCNATSSRSHCLIRITLSSFDAPERRKETNKIWMVDLGGSERVLKTKAQGKRFEEGKAINLSLSALGDVINALQKRMPHVPYRNSKLTQVLRDCLGEDSKTLMLVHVSPEEDDLCETLCSLSFATRVRSTHLGHDEPTETQSIKEVKVAKQLQKVKELEFECQNVRIDINKLHERLNNLTGSFPSSNDHLEAFHPNNEDPQSHVQMEKRNGRDLTGALLSKLPRFMRPTVSSRRKNGIDFSNKENRQRKDHTRKRVRRSSSVPAESITFPLKGISEHGSEYSISRHSCLLRSKMKRSADYEREYSYNESECHVKSVESWDDKTSEIMPPRTKPLDNRESSAEYGTRKKDKIDTRKEDKIDTRKEIKVENRAFPQKIRPTDTMDIHQGKQVVANIPPAERKKRGTGLEEAEILSSEDVGNCEVTKKRLSDKNNAQIGITQCSEIEVVIAKTPTSSNNDFTEESLSNQISPDNDIIKETQHALNDTRNKNKKQNPAFPPDSWSDQSNQNKHNGLLTGKFDKQVLMSETQSKLEDSRITEGGYHPSFPYDTGSNKAILNKKSSDQVCKSELEPENWSCCHETSDEVAVPPTQVQQEFQKAPVSERNTSKEDRDISDFAVSPQCVEGITAPILQKPRSQTYLIMDQKDANHKNFTTPCIKCQDKKQNTGICDFLKQKVQILHYGILLGIGIQSLELGHDFYYGLKL